MDLELAYRTGRFTSRDITLLSMRRTTGFYGDDDDPIPIVVVGCYFEWEIPFQALHPDQDKERRVKLLTPWLIIETMDETPPSQMPVRIGDPLLRLEGY